jgi:hypothetical protein
MTGLVIPVSPAQQRLREQLDMMVHATLRQQSYAARLLMATSWDRVVALADRWEKEAASLVAFGFVYGDQLREMATRLRSGVL